jgi:hypothetical protein
MAEPLADEMLTRLWDLLRVKHTQTTNDGAEASEPIPDEVLTLMRSLLCAMTHTLGFGEPEAFVDGSPAPTCATVMPLVVKLAQQHEGDPRSRESFRDGVMAATYWYTMLLSKHIGRTRQAAKGLTDGRQKRTDKATQRQKHIRDAVQERLRRHPKQGLTFAREHVARELNISVATVRRATAGMKVQK